MDENQFFAGLQGEKQQGSDLVDGAEHFVRLKMQTGYQQRQQDEFEKEAGDPAEAVGAGGSSKRPGYCEACDRVKEACMCKTASLHDLVEGARAGLKFQGFGAHSAKTMLQTPGMRARGAGMAAGLAAPVAAGAAGAYAIGKHRGEKEKNAYEFDELRGNEEGRPADERSIAARLKARYQEKCANALLDHVKDIDPILLAATGGGALAGGLGTYLSSKPRKDLDGKSRAEDELEAQVAAQEGRPEGGLLHKMKNRTTELEHGYAQAFREHPGKAALLGALTGGVGGYGLGRLGGAIARMRGGAA